MQAVADDFPQAQVARQCCGTAGGHGGCGDIAAVAVEMLAQGHDAGTGDDHQRRQHAHPARAGLGQQQCGDAGGQGQQPAGAPYPAAAAVAQYARGKGQQPQGAGAKQHGGVLGIVQAKINAHAGEPLLPLLPAVARDPRRQQQTAQGQGPQGVGVPGLSAQQYGDGDHRKPVGEAVNLERGFCPFRVGQPGAAPGNQCDQDGREREPQDAGAPQGDTVHRAPVDGEHQQATQECQLCRLVRQGIQADTKERIDQQRRNAQHRQPSARLQ